MVTIILALLMAYSKVTFPVLFFMISAILDCAGIDATYRIIIAYMEMKKDI